MEKIDEISMVFPCDIGRVPLLLNALSKYKYYNVPNNVEIIIVTRTFSKLIIPGLDIKVIKYKHNGEYFCPAKAFNIGVKNTKYKNVIITFPDIRPVNNVLKMFFESKRDNYVCKVFDLDPCGKPFQILFGTGYRDEWPGLYFLACYKKEDIETINGWDMRFMEGYSNEDIDFGQRMVNAGITYIIRDDIIGEHQYHERGDQNSDGYKANRKLYEENKELKIIKAINGLSEV